MENYALFVVYNQLAPTCEVDLGSEEILAKFIANSNGVPYRNVRAYTTSAKKALYRGVLLFAHSKEQQRVLFNLGVSMGVICHAVNLGDMTVFNTWQTNNFEFSKVW